MTDAPLNLAELPEDTREFLAGLSTEDVQTIKAGLPIVRMILAFGKVTKWIAITLLGILAGVVLLSESVVKIVGWIKGGP